MRRTAEKLVPGAPHQTLLVMDATTGQNGLQQARLFTEAAHVTGIVLTRDWLVEQMVDTAAQAAADRAHAPRTRALELLGREKGAFTERKDLVVRSFANLSTEEIEELLAGEPAPGASGKSGGSLAGGTGAKKARGRKQG